MTEIALIAAMARRRIIGRLGAMPWHIPGELARFKATTWGAPVIVGYTTYLGLPRSGTAPPLPGRRVIVLSRQSRDLPAGVALAHDPASALALAGAAPRVWIAGGASVYDVFLPRADTLHLSEIDADYDGDTAFPAFAPEEWTLFHDEPVTASPPYSVRIYRRIAIPADPDNTTD